MDRISPESRSKLMARVSGKDTKPEMRVRRLLHRLGLRFRLHRKDLPGKPDIVLPKWRVAIFVHGCFWHQHAGCPKASRPTSNTDFWDCKLDRNIDRDADNMRKLRDLGWRILVIWECQTASPSDLEQSIESFIGRAADSEGAAGLQTR